VSTYQKIFLLCLISCWFGCAPALAEKRVALVIGNSAYVSVPRLPNAENDARLIAETLQSLSFTLVGDRAQLDLDEASFRHVVQDFGRALQGSDVGLFYYAGHGVQLRGGNFLVPIGANPTREADIDFQMIDSNLVLHQMESAGTKLNIVILDACRNNPFIGRGLRSTEAGLTPMRAPEGTVISFATQPGNVALDGDNGNSPYSRALAQVMRKPGLDVFQTFNQVGLQVTASTGGAQQPWISLSPLNGDFYFAGRASPDSEKPSNAPDLSPAAKQQNDKAAMAWAAVQSTRDKSVLEVFITKYGDGFYGDLARARLKALEADEQRREAPPKETNDRPKKDKNAPERPKLSQASSGCTYLTGCIAACSKVGLPTGSRLKCFGDCRWIAHSDAHPECH
jgi:uncharacterized caspase-like protein